MLCWIACHGPDTRIGKSRLKVGSCFVYSRQARADLISGTSAAHPQLTSDTAPHEWSNALQYSGGTIVGLALLMPTRTHSVDMFIDNRVRSLVD